MTAVPFGTRPGTEDVPMAQTGEAPAYRQALHTYRLQQGAQLQQGPTISLFGTLVEGEASIVPLELDSQVLTPTLIVEWVGEAGSRLWIVRISQAQTAQSSSPSVTAAFLSSLSGLALTNTTLAQPTTLTAMTNATSQTTNALAIQPHQVNTRPLVAQSNSAWALPYPAWWNGNCDANTHTGSYPLGGSWLGMEACGPTRSYFVVQICQSCSWGVAEWQCVELSMRYMYLAYGIHPYPANGSEVVQNYQKYKSQYNPNGPALNPISNGTPNQAPLPGDVLSYGPTSTNGHTSVVIASNVDGSGNSTITVLEENASANGISRLNVQGWFVVGNWATVSGWLPTNALSAYQASQPTHLGSSQNLDLDEFEVASNASLYHLTNSATSGNPNWGGWTSIGGPLYGIHVLAYTIGNASNGREYIFTASDPQTENPPHVWYNYQSTINGSFKNVG